jgi:DNA ligase-associated metallophosphoesterase
MIDVQICGIDLQLLPTGGAYWPKQDMLLVADLHLGKASSFRKVGIPVPTGSSGRTLAKVSQMLKATDASRLTILGDMFHAASSLTPQIKDQLRQMFDQHPAVHFTLIRGNHDAKIRFWKGWPVDVIEEVQVIDRVALIHDPSDAQAELSTDVDLLVGGHIHPAVRIQSQSERIGKLPCFHFLNGRLILPAVGEFTGTHVLQRLSGDRVWAIADQTIIAL